MAPTGSLELYQSLMKWLRTFPTTKDEADVTDGVDMAKVNGRNIFFYFSNMWRSRFIAMSRPSYSIGILLWCKFIFDKSASGM
jgi:hypothetical protein